MSEFLQLPDYDQAQASFALPVPEFYNFGFDLIDKRAAEVDRTALV